MHIEPITHIGELVPDPRNARAHNARNIGMIVNSLHEVGAARSIVIDEHGRVLCGNGTVVAAAEAGIERVKVVDADGETIIAVRRTSLTEAQKTRLALLDNRSAELAEWDSTVLAELAEDSVKLDDLWGEWELNALLNQIKTPDDPRAHWDGMPELASEPRAHRIINIYFSRDVDVEDFAGRLGISLTKEAKTLWWPRPPE